MPRFVLPIERIFQIGRSSQQLPWAPGMQPAMVPSFGGRFVTPTGNSPAVEGIINRRADFGVLQNINGMANNIPPIGRPPPNPVGIGLANTIVSRGTHSSIPHTYNGRRRNYRLKRAVSQSRAQTNRQPRGQGRRAVSRSRTQTNRQNQPRGQRRGARRPPPHNPRLQNQPPPSRRAGRPLRAGRKRKKYRRQNSGKGSKRGQNIEIEREVMDTGRRRLKNSRQWRRNRTSRRHPAPLQRWNQIPTWQPPSTTATPVWQPQTTVPSVWQPFLFDWFTDWFPPTVPPSFYAPSPSPSSVEHSQKHGRVFYFEADAS